MSERLQTVVKFGTILMSLGVSVLSCFPVLADSPVVYTQSFPHQTGFPRLEPNGTLWFASPSVVDINNDGSLDILVADGSGCIWGWDHKGRLLSGFPWMTSGSCQNTPRINGPLAIGDVDGDGEVEVAAGTMGIDGQPGNRGRVFVWNANGTLLPGWPHEMAWNVEHGDGHPEVYSVALANLAGNTQLEILAGTSNNASAGGTPGVDVLPNLYAWHGDASLLPGYPTWNQTAGIYGLIGAADLTGDGYAEVITGRDHQHLHVNKPDGQYLAGWPVTTFVDPTKTSSSDPRLTFTKNAPAMGDLDGNGSIEIIIAGKLKQVAGGASIGSGVLVFEPNGQRHPGWSIAKLGGPPLYDEFLPSQAPALGDLDADGKLEIVVALSDGIIRAYRENGSMMWQYDYAQGRRLFASEPVIGDVTGDGLLDVVFGTYSPDGVDKAHVKLLGLSANGQPLPNFPLPLTHEGNKDRQGLRGAPTLADIDQDCDVEILASSLAGVVYVWDLAAPYDSARMPWPTGRHDNFRSGTFGNLSLPLDSADDISGSSDVTLYLPILGRCARF